MSQKKSKKSSPRARGGTEGERELRVTSAPKASESSTSDQLADGERELQKNRRNIHPRRWWAGPLPQAGWRAALMHGSIIASLVAVVAALWSVAALVVALLAHPVPTMTTIERDGARGVPTLVRQGPGARHTRTTAAKCSSTPAQARSRLRAAVPDLPNRLKRSSSTATSRWPRRRHQHHDDRFRGVILIGLFVVYGLAVYGSRTYV